MTDKQKIRKYLKEKKALENTGSYIKKSAIKEPLKYEIHDNRTIPWYVFCEKKIIQIVPVNPHYRFKHKKIDNQIIRITEFLGYWYGFDIRNSKYDGNSVLIHIENKKYMFVGYYIYTFEFEENIIDFISPLGNNDVPYPVAYTKNYVIFMLDKKAIKKSTLKTKATPEGSEDLYGEYYGHLYKENMKNHEYTLLKKIKMIKNLEET